MYQAGFFPVMMFGLPAGAFAIYQCARPEKKSYSFINVSRWFCGFLYRRY